jgi:hypothetical protein
MPTARESMMKVRIDYVNKTETRNNNQNNQRGNNIWTVQLNKSAKWRGILQSQI